MTLAILLGAGLGAVLGSFGAVVALRWPRGRAADGRSRCDACGMALGARDLVPLLSFIGLRGRCRGCGARIDPLHVAMEAAGLVMGGVAFALLPPATALAGLGFGIALLVLAALDIGHLWLPDRIVLPLGGLGLGLSLTGIGAPVADTLVGAAAGFGLLWLVGEGYRRLRGRRGLGGGDPKLFGAIGAWTGWVALPFVLVAACALGLVLLLADAARGRGVRADMRVPLGALLAAAAWPIWLWISVRG